MIEAKPVVADRYWILKKDDRKVGTVEADEQGLRVRINGRTQKFQDMPVARRQAEIDFQPAYRVTPQPRDQVHGYSTGCRVHNAMWDVRRRLPLFTRYQIQQHQRWSTVRNPKLIILDRYQYQGPFATQEQAHNKSV
jgi:hypothetical protein